VGQQDVEEPSAAGFGDRAEPAGDLAGFGDRAPHHLDGRLDQDVAFDVLSHGV
jgi:hypothetical protein